MSQPYATASMTLDQSAKNYFRNAGVTIADWAVANGFSPALVYAVLSGRRKCLRGKSYEIALVLQAKIKETEHKEEEKMG
jgi:gp16 family phage-associated protein